ncbi:MULTISPECIES: hypothetical protein [Oceanobacillus]|uniref:Uncharacterized protein n=1 Tax=Oceanobacillus neutriphilus TaxID=531815 RepID=A0ABQ2P383_9BACI|nr:hypothetical protein [Oceanobacillus neutriphilus]GGP17180.1 hypothetical protein GCM10011346_52080 [Oceanobacillus neutriphilus]
MSYQADEEFEWILEDRVKRLRNLTGKFVVVTKGKSSGKQVFFQDQRISNEGYWTQFLSNAYGFSDESKAKSYASRFKFNNPKVAIVTASGNYRFL